MGDLVVASGRTALVAGDSVKQFVTMRVDGQLFGIPVMVVHDILRQQVITPIPCAPKEVRGAINLRGRIVTVVDMRNRVGAEILENIGRAMHVVVEYKGESYSLMVDEVGEVLNLSLEQFERNPPNLSEKWQPVSVGVYRLEEELLVVLDIASLLAL